MPIASISLFVVSLVELHITPFDMGSAKAEILAGTETEYSGKNLFFYELTQYMKKLFYIMLLPLFLLGIHDFFLFIAAAFFFLFLFSYMQATTPRYRVDQGLKKYFILMILALFEFIRISWGITW